MITALKEAKEKKRLASTAATVNTTSTAASSTPAKKPRGLDAFFAKSTKPTQEEEKTSPPPPSPVVLVMQEDSLPATALPPPPPPAAAAAAAAVSDVVEVEDSLPPSVSSNTNNSSPVRAGKRKAADALKDWRAAEDKKEDEAAPAAAPAAATAKPSKVMLPEHVAELKQVVRQHGAAKSKDELCKLFKAALTSATYSAALVGRTLADIAARDKWSATADSNKTWRVKEDLSEEELAFAAAAAAQPAAAAAASQATAPKRAKTGDAAASAPPVASEAELALQCACRQLLRDVFAYLPPVASSTSSSSQVDFSSSTPSSDAVQVIALVVASARCTAKDELARRVVDKLAAAGTEDGAKTTVAAAQWIDLVAKRVDYGEEDLWAYEMENARGKRHTWLKQLVACRRDLTKLLASSSSSREDGLKKVEERVAKVKREFFVASSAAESSPKRQQQDTTPPATVVPQATPKISPLARFFGEPKQQQPQPPPPHQAEEEEEEEVQVLAATPVPAPPSATRRRPAARRRDAIYLFVDSRVQVLSRAQQRSKYGVERGAGRHPLRQREHVDYEMDSEDEDGESLAEDDEDDPQPADELDYSDKWLAPEDDGCEHQHQHQQQQQQLHEQHQKHEAEMKAITSLPTTGGGGVMVSIRNLPFEPHRCSFPQLVLASFPVVVYRKPQSAVAAAETDAEGQVEEQQPKSSSSSKKAAAGLSAAQLAALVHAAEGSALKREELVASIAQQLQLSKLQVGKRLGEVACKLAKRWLVRSGVLEETKVPRHAENATELLAYHARKHKKPKGVKEAEEAKEEEEGLIMRQAEEDLFTKKEPKPAAAVVAVEPLTPSDQVVVALPAAAATTEVNI